MSDTMEVLDHFQAAIRPVVSKKLSGIVTDLTNIKPEDLEDGTTFQQMIRDFSVWLGEEPTAILTWSTTDLLVMMENCRFFFDKQEIPFLTHYMDFQAYAQRRMGVDSSQQLGLAKAGNLLEIPEDDMSLHRALDDSILTSEILKKVYERDSFVKEIQTVDEEFYRRVTFKTAIIKDIDSPLVKQSQLCFNCPDCGQSLKRKGSYRFHNRAFCADFVCRKCQKTYRARVQYRLKYEGVEVRRKLSEVVPQEEKAEEAAPAQP